MTAVLLASLGLPLLGAVATVVAADRRWITTATAGAAALGWAVLATPATAPTVGRIVVTPLVAATVAGAALLVAADPPRSWLARSAASCAVTVLAVGASTGDGDAPDRPLAVAVLALTALVILRLRADGEAVLWPLSPALSGLALGVGLLQDDPVVAAVVVAAASAGIVAGALIRPTSAPLLLPVAVLATARVTDAAHAVADDGATTRATLVAAAGVAAAAGLVVVVRAWRRRRSGSPADRPLLPVAVVGAGLALVADVLPELQSAGVLLAAGGVLAVAARHPIGLVATVPGLAAALEAFGAADEPVQAAAGAAAVAVLLAAGVPAGSAPPGADGPVAALAVALAVGFGVVPLWGWSGATPEGYTTAVLVAAAAAAVVVTGSVAVGRPGRSGGMTTGPGPDVGRLRRRTIAVDHGSTHPLVEEGGPVEAGTEVPEGASEGRVGHSPQHPVAVPPRAVPDRPAAGGVGGRRRLRARPGRPAG